MRAVKEGGVVGNTLCSGEGPVAGGRAGGAETARRCRCGTNFSDDQTIFLPDARNLLSYAPQPPPPPPVTVLNNNTIRIPS